jgi:ferric-dicitrate binding protein FerR (iron transport regulator)
MWRKKLSTERTSHQDYDRKALKAIAEEAARWLHTLDRADERELDAFSEWLLQSPLHEEVFIAIVDLDQALSHIAISVSAELENRTRSR